MTGRPARIVVRSPNWLGDAVMALPLLRDLRRHFASSFLAVAAPASLTTFYESVPGVDAVVTLGGTRHGGAWQRREHDAQVLARERFDLGVLLPNSFGSAWVLRRAKVPERWGYRANWRGWLLTRAVRPPRGMSSRPLHQAQYYLELARALAIQTAGLGAELPVPEVARSRANQALREAGVDPREHRIVGLAPGAAYGGAKRWPPERVAQLVRRLGESEDVVCLFLGSEGDRPTARAVEAALTTGSSRRDIDPASPVRTLDFVGKTDLGLLMGLLWHCRAVVSNDSGAMHLASAIGRPVVAIFGPTDERVTAPLGEHRLLQHSVRCRPCLLRECPIDHRCMKGVTVEMVFNAVQDYVRVG